MIKREDCSKIVKGWDDINNNVLSETSIRSMTPPITKYIRPNNYRRLINIKIVSESGISKILTTPLSKQNPQNHIIDIPNYRNSGISLQVCKQKLIGIYSQVYSNGKKYWYKIVRETDQEINEVIESKKEEIKVKIDLALKLFCEEFNLGFKFDTPIWLRSETAIHGDDYIDRIPRDLIIHDTIFKKVYKDDLEFKSGKGEEPVVHLKNYITNRSIESIAPSISNEINLINNKLNNFINTIEKLDKSINWLDTNIVSHKEVLGEMKDTLKIIQSISTTPKEEYSPNINSVCTPPFNLPLTLNKYSNESEIENIKVQVKKDNIKKLKDKWW